MSRRIAYLGDTALPGPANYLAGIMTHYRLPFEYVPSHAAPPEAVFSDDVGLYVLSDYPSAQFSGGTMARLCERVRNGAGLLMLGGWESYHGLGGDYDRTPLAGLLPVEMLGTDDRRNWYSLIIVRQTASHPVLQGLPFDRPPGIGGYNEFRVKPGAAVILEGERYTITAKPDAVFAVDGRFPLLVAQEFQAGAAGAGRRACLATDVAPHWVGGFVDWGDKRLKADLPGGFVEVGVWYAQFFRNLLTWCLGA